MSTESADEEEDFDEEDFEMDDEEDLNCRRISMRWRGRRPRKNCLPPGDPASNEIGC